MADSDVVHGSARDPAVGPATRWGGGGGILFAVAFVVGILLMTDTPEGDAPDTEWLDYYADSGNRWKIIVGALALALSTIGLIIFLSALRERLRDAPGTQWLSTVMLASGLVLLAMIGLAGSALGAVAAGVEIGDVAAPASADVPRFLEQFAFGGLLLFGMVAGGVMIGASSAAGERAGLLPRWLVVSGYIAAVIVLLGGLLFLPMALLVIWVLAVSILMMRAPSRRSAPAAIPGP
jgi:hypothetical protein